eukprot:Rmarinus@m.17927
MSKVVQVLLGLLTFLLKITVMWICFFLSPILRLLGIGEEKVSSPEGKRVVITGCDTGFGYLTAMQLDREGFSVVACCLTDDGVKKLRREGSDKLTAIQVDVTKDESVAKAVQTVSQLCRGRGLFALINNAGVIQGNHVAFTPMQQFEFCSAVNYLGVVRCTKAFLPLIQDWNPYTEEASARIIVLTSVAGLVPASLMSAYAASKHAAEGFAKAIRRELRDVQIHVSLVNPGFFKTPLISDVALKNLKDLVSANRVLVDRDYGDAFVSKIHEHVDRIPKLCGDPLKVVNGLSHAVAAKTPYMRYLIGGDAQVVGRYMYMVPDEIGDFVEATLRTKFGLAPIVLPLYRKRQIPKAK